MNTVSRIAVNIGWLAMLWLSAAAGAAIQDQTERPIMADGRYAKVLTGEAVTSRSAKTDTVCLFGSGGEYDDYYGNFSVDATGEPSFDRWYGVDLTEPPGPNWHIDTYNASTTPCLDPATVPNHSWWCGEPHPSCFPTDPAGGYGNNYEEFLDWWGEVVPPFNPGEPLNVTVTAKLSHDNEPGYDYLYLQYEGSAGQMIDFSTPGVYNGTQICVTVSEIQFGIEPIDRFAHGGKWVHLRWYFTSDGAFSDQDCFFPSEGAAQIDLIEVIFKQGTEAMQIGETETCEPGDPQKWQVFLPVGVGDYARAWPYLRNIDACCINLTPQIAFIAHPATGLPPYACETYCYGPDGYIVHPEGGAAGPEEHIHNQVWSPILCWPGPGYEGARFNFTEWRHETLIFPDSPGMFWQWFVRSTAEDSGHWPCDSAPAPADPPYDVNDPAQAPFWPDFQEYEWQGWQDRSFVNYGGPDCVRSENTIGDLLLPDRKYVQVALGVYEAGWIWGWTGTNGTPAPYFDDVQFLAYEFGGPAITTREIELAQDSFPASGDIDCHEPCQNSIRFDMARNIAQPEDPVCNLPGDSIVCDIHAVRSGTELIQPSRMHYELSPNPLFDGCRTTLPPDCPGMPPNTYYIGCVAARYTYNNSGALVPDRYNFDLPDTGFFFPGDQIHYFIRAEDSGGGVTFLPGDTTGFSFFPGDPDYEEMRFPSSFITRGLPTITDLGTCDQAPILWWNDFADRGLENEWMHSFRCLGYDERTDFDIYYTNGPTSGVGNGLGGRATATQLSGYGTILYSSGDLGFVTLSNGDCFSDPGPDIAVLDSWLLTGDRCLLLSGNDLISDLQAGGATAIAFNNDWIGAELFSPQVQSHTENSTHVEPWPAPPGNPLCNGDPLRWSVYSSCNPGYRFPDAILPTGTAQSWARWLLADCVTPEATELAAGLYSHHPAFNDLVITLPYDLGWVIDPGTPCQPNATGAGCTVRAELLRCVLAACGFTPLPPQVVDVPALHEFTASTYPNPFNPSIKIEYSVPARSSVTIEIYDLKGRLVRTLLDEVVDAGTDWVLWDGSDASGRDVSSGVYFSVARHDGKEVIEKIALVR